MPDVPKNVRKVDATSTSIQVAWDSSGAAIEYEYRINGGSVVPVGTFTWITISNLVANTAYQLEVRAVEPETISEPLPTNFSANTPRSDWSVAIIVKTEKIKRNDWTVLWQSPERRFFDAGLDRGVLYPNSGPAVPWDGLISVDQSGGDSSVSYYIDGRPYLHFPPPREYEATLKAFTFPDEFSDAMGFPEVADGLYLDSQVGDTFGLSYRTLVGNGTQGTDHGYKIHIVYNATASMESTSYETLSQSIGPVEFAWSIKAVPVNITGRRATAHVVIDTRHLDPMRVKRIENMLYGTPNVPAALPTPSTLFDILNLAEDIVVTDNGDGTWTADGSYKNVFETQGGVFEITNVNAVDLGDGTYTISTTTVV